MTEKIETNKKFDSSLGMVITWDKDGNMFVNMPVHGIPKKQFEEWMRDCKVNYSGKRWDKIIADHIKARSYDEIRAMMPNEEDIPETKEINELGLLKGGND